MPQRPFKKSSDFSSRGRFPRRSDRSDKPYNSDRSDKPYNSDRSDKPYNSFRPQKSFSRDRDTGDNYERENGNSGNAPYTPNSSNSFNDRYKKPEGRDRGGFKERPPKDNFGEYRERRPFERGARGPQRDNSESYGRRDFQRGDQKREYGGGGDRDRGREGGGFRDRERGNDRFGGRGRSQGGRPDWKERGGSNSYRGRGDYGPSRDRGDRGDRAGRDRHRGERENNEPAMSLLIGVRPIEEAIRKGVKFNQLYLQKSENDQPSKFEEFIQYCKDNKINFFFLEKRKLDDLSKHKLHQGVIAELKQDTRIVPDLQAYFTKYPPQGETVLVLDRLTDQQNVGAITRSAYFFGCRLIISEKTHSAPINEVVHKVSSGASLMVSFHFAEKLSQAINTLKDFGFNVIATSVDGDEETSVATIEEEKGETASPSIPSMPLGEFHPNPDIPAAESNYAVVMGSEGSGLRPHLERLSDTKVHIPRLSDFDSLNVSVATGIVLYGMMQNGFIQPPKEIPYESIEEVEDTPIEEQKDLSSPESSEAEAPKEESEEPVDGEEIKNESEDTIQDDDGNEGGEEEGDGEEEVEDTTETK